jgi:hypothetical protein
MLRVVDPKEIRIVCWLAAKYQRRNIPFAPTSKIFVGMQVRRQLCQRESSNILRYDRDSGARKIDAVLEE